MSAMQRNKGAVAEREVVNILRAKGLKAQRTAPLQAAPGRSEDADVIGVEGHYLEIRRRERVEIDKWCAETELAAPPTQVPVVAWRKSRQPWRVALLMDDFLDLVRRANL